VHTNTILSVIGITVAAAVSLIVAYLHRKQMRQIEIFRKDPSAGLKPSPHPLLLFLKRKRLMLLTCGSSLVVLASEMTRQTPFTRMSALFISLGVAGFLSGLLMGLLDRLLTLLEKMSAAFGKQTDNIGQMIEVMHQHSELLGQGDERS
jgi:hypothetical protein